jgi:(p)ppGpp synthase/HD superfamily hydrolase
MATLERAIAIASEAHQGQLDKAGQPYVLHPLRMMQRLSGEQAQIVAVLHDVVEDTPWSLAQLRAEGFSEALLAAVDALTRREAESYEEFIERLLPNPLARQVKLADLEDNMDLRRIAELGEKDWERLQRYHRAWRRISQIAQG